MNTKLNIIQFAFLQGLLAALLGVIAGVFYSIGGFFIDLFVTLNLITSSETPGLSIGTLYAMGALIGMPILFAVSGFLLGMLEAFLYNIISKWIRIPNFNIYQ